MELLSDPVHFILCIEKYSQKGLTGFCSLPRGPGMTMVRTAPSLCRALGRVTHVLHVALTVFQTGRPCGWFVFGVEREHC